MSPVHIRAGDGDVAPDVLLVGDPGRATRTAELLQSARCYNDHRGLLGYTGMHAGRPISVQTTGMGCPSAAIVCEELAMLGARRLIRMGTCGALQPHMRPADLVIATAACSLDGTVRAYVGDDGYAPGATFGVVRALDDAARARNARHHVGLIATEDALYAVGEDWVETWRGRGVLAQEMEASAIFTVAALRGLEAGCILVASNSAGQHERLPDDELAPAVELMINVTLDAVAELSGETS